MRNYQTGKEKLLFFQQFSGKLMFITGVVTEVQSYVVGSAFGFLSGLEQRHGCV